MNRYLRACSLILIFAIVGTLQTQAVAQDDSTVPSADPQPNVLFIAMDDLNDWIGCLGGHPQTITPNLDRLAASGTLFTNAHCAAPACNPSRGAIFSGRAPNRSGLYDNRQQMREVMHDATLLPQYFRDHGYRASGSGKLLHYVIDAKSWDDYFPAPATENPLPETYYPEVRPVNLSRGGPWQYIETDWAALDVTDEQFGGDWSVSRWIGEQLQQPQEKSFFLACGIYRPHEPWFVPKKYFEPFPLDSIQLPPGYLENDLDDVPPAGVRGARNRYFEHIRNQGQWRQGVQSYLASIHFADTMLGRVIDALDASPYAENTIVVLWSDHGWQLGEKEHWQKFTAWRAVTRVPLIVRVPKGISKSLPSGTIAGTKCEQPVNLLSLFPTLLDLCSLPAKADNDGPSLVPLLLEPEQGEWNAAWPHASITYLADPGSYSASTRSHRYIHYANGDEELYDITTDPYEWHNMASNAENETLLRQLRTLGPDAFAERRMASVDSLIQLPWQSFDKGQALPSKPDGNPFDVHFINQREMTVELFWMDRNGAPKSYGKIDSGQRQKQQTRPGAVWMIADSITGEQLGHFVVDDRPARAIIPPADN
jgi:arylsulfatase A-like enzyme